MKWRRLDGSGCLRLVWGRAWGIEIGANRARACGCLWRLRLGWGSRGWFRGSRGRFAAGVGTTRGGFSVVVPRA
jgi:hypothetical protein